MAFFFELIGFIVILIFAFVPKLIEKPCPKGYVFNHLKSAKDLASGISKWEHLRRKNRGDYWITYEEYRAQTRTKHNQKSNREEVVPGVVDIDRYNYDKETYSEKFAEGRRKIGGYKRIIPKEEWI